MNLAADTLRRMIGDTRGVSAIEFALVVPVFMVFGMFGAEIAWMNAAAMEASQVAIALADNASRLGQTDNSGVTPTITAADVDSVLKGALAEGSNIALEENGRVILSSLEIHPVTGRQYIRWQQCSGALRKPSTNGPPDLAGSAISPVASGVRLGGRTIAAPQGSAVMIAEVWYEYRGLFGTMFVQPTLMHQEAAVIVRDDRNLKPGLSGTIVRNGC